MKLRPTLVGLFILFICGGFAFLAGSRYSRLRQSSSVIPVAAPGTTYKQIWECPIEAFEHFVKINAESRENLVRGIARNAPNSESNGVYFAGVLARLTQFSPPESELLKDLKTEFQRREDHLFYYYETSAGGWEEGWLIARDGKTRKKYPFASSGK